MTTPLTDIIPAPGPAPAPAPAPAPGPETNTTETVQTTVTVTTNDPPPTQTINTTQTPNDYVWNQTLPEDLRMDEDVLAAKSIEDFVRGYQDLKGKFNETFSYPNQNSSDEQVTAYYEAQNIPTDVNQYNINFDSINQAAVSNLGIALENIITPEWQDIIKSAAHSSAINPEAATTFAAHIANAEVKMKAKDAESKAALLAKDEAETKAMLGDQFESTMIAVGNFVQTNYPELYAETYNNGQIVNKQFVQMAMAAMGNNREATAPAAQNTGMPMNTKVSKGHAQQNFAQLSTALQDRSSEFYKRYNSNDKATRIAAAKELSDWDALSR